MRKKKRSQPEQLELSPRRTWGGRRKGAGRPKSGRVVGVPHRERPPHERDYPLHVTFRVRRDVPSLRGRIFQLVRRKLSESHKAFFRVTEFSVQGNHIHLIVEADDRVALTRGMIGLATRIAMAINRACRRRGRVLCDRYFARELRTPIRLRMALVYVLMNHKRHIPHSSGIDGCSSGPWFAGWAQAPRATGPPPTLPSKTRLDWRRFGLIHLKEGPNAHLVWEPPDPLDPRY